MLSRVRRKELFKGCVSLAFGVGLILCGYLLAPEFIIQQILSSLFPSNFKLSGVVIGRRLADPPTDDLSTDDHATDDHGGSSGHGVVSLFGSLEYIEG
ncbi:hypothetical protein EON65_57555, partial [archaeon]